MNMLHKCINAPCFRGLKLFFLDNNGMKLFGIATWHCSVTLFVMHTTILYGEYQICCIAGQWLKHISCLSDTSMKVACSTLKK
jgi:hypothetical protein